MSNKGNLPQTKGSFKLAGIVSGINRDNTFVEDTGKNGKDYRKLQFRVQTSPTNTIPVELFGAEQDFVYPYSSKDKKSAKIPFSQREQVPQGYHIIGVSATLGMGLDGKPKRVSMVDYDAAQYIYHNLNDGDQVWLNGEPEFQTFENKQGETVNSTKFKIKSVGLTQKPIDFDAPDFKETAEFEQEIVVLDTIVDRETKKVYVNAYTIGYGDKLNPAQFVINAETHKDFANAFVKKCVYGTWIKVYGKIINAVELGEPEAVKDEWGGEIPDSYNRPIRSEVKELRIIGADSTSFEPKKFTEEELTPKFTVETGNPFEDTDDDDETPF